MSEANQPPEALRQALALHMAGQFERADAAYRQFLKGAPRHFEALHLLGILSAQRGEMEEAVALFSQAIEIQPESAATLNNFANALRALGRIDEALALYDRAIAAKADYAEAHNNRGAALLDAGRMGDALAAIEQAILLKPDHASAHFNRANALRRLGRDEEALESFAQALLLNPDYAEAYNNRGSVQRALGHAPEALADFERAIALNPREPSAHLNRAITLHESGRWEEALATLDRLVAMAPSLPKAHFVRGDVLFDLKRYTEAIVSYERALALDPQLAGAYNMMGNTWRALRQYERAVESFDKAIVVASDLSQAHYNRGFALESLGRFEEALVSCDRAAALDSSSATAAGQAFLLARHLCAWGDFAARRDALAEAVHAGVPTLPFAVLTMCDEPALHAKATADFGTRFYPARSPRLWEIDPQPRGPHDRLRVAYVSADFYQHATAMLIAELFERHDRRRFEIFGISIGPDDRSEMRRRLEDGFEHFLNAEAETDVGVAALINGNAIDIVVDLKGHTRDSRPGIFSLGPAPVAINWLGYPGTMGLPCYDYILADSLVISETARSTFSEAVVTLPDCYQVNDTQRAVAPVIPTRAELGLPERGFTFASFNSLYKLNPDTFDLWMAILRETPDSVLWLLAGNEPARANLKREAEARGVAAERLVMADFERDAAKHLARLSNADLALDTYPCNGHTTTSDALWVGVPVVTLAGQSFPARVAASLLTATELPDLIAPTPEAYRALAIALARDPARLAERRKALAASRPRCPLFDSTRFTRHIEAAFTAMWSRHEAGLAPESFAVEPIG